MRVIGRNSPKTAITAIGGDLRASYPPETSASEEITRLLQRLCAIPGTGAMNESRVEASRPQAFVAAR
ncbi:MAG: hypothetical protein QOG66_796 [Methylobacteriaceae bacterium]|jgi:hypothetical protein|nr:hypothetical protein [Methylobacteriaceae bacterium]